MSIWDEEPKLEITEVRAIINGIEVKNGDVFLLIKDGEIIERGTIKFCVYSDGEGAYDLYHIGFIVEWDNPKQCWPRTLSGCNCGGAGCWFGVGNNRIR